jgi:hypothetical protein
MGQRGGGWPAPRCRFTLQTTSTVTVDPNMTIRDLSSLLALVLGMLLVLAAA